jgi:hypothetical protein
MFGLLEKKSLVAMAAYAANELRSTELRPSEANEIFGSYINVPILKHALAEYASGIEKGKEEDVERALFESDFSLNGYRTREVVVAFAERFLGSIRNQICKEAAKKGKKTRELSGQAVAAAVATSVTTALGTANPIAIGVSSIVILAIASAAKDAFCQMTDAEVLNALKQKADGH